MHLFSFLFSHCLSTGCMVSLRGVRAISLPRWLRTGWKSVISQGKIPWNTAPCLGIGDPGHREDRQWDSFILPLSYRDGLAYSLYSLIKSSTQALGHPVNSASKPDASWSHRSIALCKKHMFTVGAQPDQKLEPRALAIEAPHHWIRAPWFNSGFLHDFVFHSSLNNGGPPIVWFYYSQELETAVTFQLLAGKPTIFYSPNRA